MLPKITVINALLRYYKIPPEALPGFNLTRVNAPGGPGYFCFGSNICYGKCNTGVASEVANAPRFDASKELGHHGTDLCLPFDFDEVIDNLRLERYQPEDRGVVQRFASSKPVRKFYYRVRNSLPLQVRRRLQRLYFGDRERIGFPAWPVDLTVDNLHEELLRIWMQATGIQRMPFIWFWPEGAPHCLIVTHDVETSAGVKFTFDLIDLDDSHGFKAAYQVIPTSRYKFTEDYAVRIRARGCEFNIHDLNHDGLLYAEYSEFLRRAEAINGFGRRYHSQGFRAGAMYRKQEWYDHFEFAYDMSVPNVAHLEAVRGGCCTVMPYFVGKILELPLTTAQDYSLFHILNNYSIELWKRQLVMIKRSTVSSVF